MPQESARAGVEDDLQVDYMGTNSGTDMTMPCIQDSVRDGGTDPSFRTRCSSAFEFIKEKRKLCSVGRVEWPH